MNRRSFLATILLLLAFVMGSIGGRSKANAGKSQVKMRPVTAIAEDFQGKSKLIYFGETEDGERVP